MQHEHVLRSWREYEIEDGKHKSTLAVETDLVIGPDEPGFDSAKFNSFLESIIRPMKSGIVDRIKVVHVGKALPG
jgi:hypothetical protein